MKPLLVLVAFIAVLGTGCNPRPAPEFEGKAAFVYYRDENQQKRLINAAPQPKEYTPPPYVERWSADPYVRLYANYVEISYTMANSKRTTQMIPREGLYMLKWKKDQDEQEPTANPKP